ncbi:MAG: D-alanyl-D-alanine carboxypeptidase family protein [Ruminococcaceae bacterium]|nr:D-alanyl-D-alanine carboxypeptidase family protein [Oscillospiraceae bacterium]
MTREQAEKLKQENRRKRLRKKRIKAFTLLALFVVAVVIVLFFAVKGIMYLVNRDDQSEGIESPIGNAGVVDSVGENGEASSDDIISDENSEQPDIEEPEGTDSTAAPDSSEAPTVEEPANTTPVGTKPQQSWSTMLVNQWSYMPEGYVPEVRPISYEGVSPANNKFDVRAADALEQMLAAAREAGYNMYLVSAYRTHEYQVNLFNRKVNEYKALGYDDATAYSEASQWVAIPGTSEHCTGLAADIVSSTWYNYNSDLTHDFEETDHFDWLYEHCADYGFILRYPKGAEAITGITYEPWHYRFVGIDAAKYIMENHITLEEFCAE